MGGVLETWKPVANWERYYEVSDFGRIRSLDRITRGRHGPTQYRGKILKAAPNAHGYPVVCLTRADEREDVYVHDAVLRAFKGEPQPGQECCHEDDNPENNALGNLRWDTRSANYEDAKRNDKLNPPYGEKHSSHKLTTEQVIWIRANCEVFGIRATARKYGVHHGTIMGIRDGRYWPHMETAK